MSTNSNSIKSKHKNYGVTVALVLGQTMNKIDELFTILQEECAEVVQAVSKCRRFGIDNTYSKGTGSQRENLTKEIGDLQCMINLCIEHGIVEKSAVDLAILNKQSKLKIYSNLYKE